MSKAKKKTAPGRIRVREITSSKDGFEWTTHLVEWRENGERFRKKFKDAAEAEGFVATKQVELANGSALNAVTTRLTGEQVAEAEAAFQRLGDRYKLEEAVSFFLDHFAEPENPTTFADALRAFALGKEAEGVRPRSLRQLDSTLGQFRTFAEGRGINHVHEADAKVVEAFLKSLRARNGVDTASRKTWNNYRADLSSFFNWCADPRRRWVTSNPVDHVHKFKNTGRGVIEALSIKDALRLMRKVEKFKDGRLVPYFALALFAGIRPGPDGELHKLATQPDRDKLIDRKRGVIHIPESISKTSQKRQIVIRPNLARWLDLFGTDILPVNHDRDVKTLRRRHGLTHDVLRHSFITYHVSAFRSVGDAAIEAGNSEAVTKKHYLNLATQREGLAFWRIAPKGEKVESPDSQGVALRVA